MSEAERQDLDAKVEELQTRLLWGEASKIAVLMMWRRIAEFKGLDTGSSWVCQPCS